MRTFLKIAGVLLMLGAAVGGCRSLLVILMYIEPPHPDWSYPLYAPPEVRGRRTMPDGDQIVSIEPQGEGRCTLVVKRGDGSPVGHDDGRECRVYGRARRGEEWLFEATSTAPDARIVITPDPELVPRPLRATFYGCLALFPVGFFLLRKGRSIPPE